MSAFDPKRTSATSAKARLSSPIRPMLVAACTHRTADHVEKRIFLSSAASFVLSTNMRFQHYVTCIFNFSACLTSALKGQICKVEVREDFRLIVTLEGVEALQWMVVDLSDCFADVAGTLFTVLVSITRVLATPPRKEYDLSAGRYLKFFCRNGFQ